MSVRCLYQNRSIKIMLTSLLFVSCLINLLNFTDVQPRLANFCRKGEVPSSSASSESTRVPTITIRPTDKRDNCKVVDHIVYIKTHQTASTTLASILQTFGFIRNLTFAIAARGHVFSSSDLFQRNMIPQPPLTNKSSDPLEGYHLLTNHVRYSRPEMDAVIHDAKYITIIREPVAQFESCFGYFEMAKHLNLTNNSNPIDVFMATPSKFLADKFYMWMMARNGQLYDLGLDHKYHDDLYTVRYKIKQLDSEFDLIHISEHFDESLILLKKIMCWSFEDILYVSRGIRSASHRYHLNDQLQTRIREWNSADVMMYNHFNKTLWRKIREYGDDFEADLAEFRHMRRAVMQKCIDEQRINTEDKREDKFVLKQNMTGSDFCENVLRGDVQYTRLIRVFMQKRGLYPVKKTRKTRKIMK